MKTRYPIVLGVLVMVAVLAFFNADFLYPQRAHATITTTFMEPGGDADFAATAFLTGFWTNNAGGTGAIATDFVHGNHLKSIKFAPNGTNILSPPVGVVADSGSRISFYIYINALPSATASVLALRDGFNGSANIKLTSGGVLQLWNASTAQIGSNGSTLSTGTWYRVSLAYTITDTTHNRFELFVNGISDISVTNATITTVNADRFYLGNVSANSTLDIRTSDHYVDNSSSLTDTGNIWVTAKRPNASGASNQFITQIGSGGSGYGTGHSPQVNERALSTTNGWSIQNASTQTEEYSIESAATGDIDISAATIVDYEGWISAKVGSASTGNIIVNGATTNKSVTTSYAMYTKIAGSTTYPSGNTAIGIDTNSVNQLFSLAEAGVLIAYIPATPLPTIPTTYKQLGGSFVMTGGKFIAK